jgi:DNA modification methylase
MAKRTRQADTLIRSRIVGHGDVKPEDLLANPLNFRRHPGTQMDALRGSMKELGWLKTILINKTTGHVLDGHARVEEAMRQGLPSIPATIVELSPEEERLALAVLDPITEMATRDQDILDQLLADVETQDAGLQALLDELAGKEPEPPASGPKEGDDPDWTPDAAGTPITQPGDLWTLGRHRLLCGDSTKPEDVDRLTEGARVDCVFTDPPYAIYGSSTGIAADITDDKMVRPFFRDVVVQSTRVLKPFGHLYICCDWRSWASWWEVCKGTGITAKNMVVWDKGGGMGSMYANAHELLLFASFRPLRENMSQKITGERTCQGSSNIWRVSRAGKDETGEKRQHNAQKPVGLVTIALKNSTDPGDTMLDFFGGSGTTMVAAEQDDRRALLMEMEPKWCDLIVSRWEALTGQKAERHKGGER